MNSIQYIHYKYKNRTMIYKVYDKYDFGHEKFLKWLVKALTNITRTFVKIFHESWIKRE